MTLNDLISSAREAAELEKWDEMDQLYRRAIRDLAKQQSRSLDLKELYLSTKAEYLCQKPYLRDQESLKMFKKRMFNAIRYLNECSRISKKNPEHYFNAMHTLVQQIVKQYGCDLFETKHHVAVSCPIQLSSDKFGSMGCSIGTIYKKMLCSICGLDRLDEKCTHDVNQIYDGKRCSIIYEGQIKDISLVQRPKDPLCRITDIFYPKEVILEKCGIDATKIDLRHKLNMRCTRCRDENIDPALITPELFFKIHGLNISMGKPATRPPRNNMRKGKLYFSSIVYVEGGGFST